MRDVAQGLLVEGEVHAVELEEAGVLLAQRVLGLGEDGHQGLLVELLQGDDDRQAADELRDQAELEQVLGLDLLKDLGEVALLDLLDVRAEAEHLLADAVLDDLLDAVKGAAADEEDVGGVDLDELLVGVLAAALRRDGGHGPLQDLEQCLLHALARDVAGDGRVLALAGDLVDLVDVDDALFRALDVVVGVLDELEEDVLHVLAHVARLGQGRGVADGKGHVEDLGERLRKEGLAAAGGPEHQDVGLLQLHVRVVRADALVVVVDRDGQGLLGVLLADDVLVQAGLDLRRAQEALARGFRALAPGELLIQDVAAEVHALVADEDAGAGHEAADLVGGLSAERALGLLDLPIIFGHALPLLTKSNCVSGGARRSRPRCRRPAPPPRRGSGRARCRPRPFPRAGRCAARGWY